ncbi:MAG: fibronectin type III domain-containing protein [candidate division Zixibacteria bacterium]|nr:fibronectin type III domain-containing protein [candidate division Zixibacteria bacterium]
MRCKTALLIFILLFLVSASALSQETAEIIIPDTTALSMPPYPAPAAPGNIIVRDNPSDGGGKILIRWDLSVDDGRGNNNVVGYEVMRAEVGSDDFVSTGMAAAGVNFYIDTGAEDDVKYIYKVIASDGIAGSASELSQPVHSYQQWLNLNLKYLFLIGALICGSVIYFIFHAKRGKKLFIRKIAGLEAIDDAVGRATEMGRPVLFIPGIRDMDDVQTIAGITILGRVARTIAEYDIKINMPVSRSIVMTTARETIKAAYAAEGRVDAYSDEFVYYLTDEQFGYVAAVDGIMVRDKPATCFYMGSFFAESLIFAETGNSIGAIQIAGTAMPAQLPFFVAACDYTLIGEELFAASAYLSGEPKQLGSLKGQDVGKFIAMVAIIFGVLAATMYSLTDAGFFASMHDFMLGLFTLN